MIDIKTTNYVVEIPKPKAKRLAELPATLVVEIGDNWNGYTKNRYQIPVGVVEAQFSVPCDAVWVGETTESDGYTFQVHVLYENKTGTRNEIFALIPKKCSVPRHSLVVKASSSNLLISSSNLDAGLI